MFPLPTPPNYWNEMRSIASQFIWKGEKPRVKNTKLCQRKLQGGFGFLNFETNHFSFTLPPLEN